MAKILYGVHGIGHGHAVRALTIARHFPEHEFLFLSHDTGAAILGQEFPVEECPNPPTIVRGHRVDVAATLFASLKVRCQSRRYLRQVLDLIDRFQPDVTMTDYEYFLPQALRAGPAFPACPSTISTSSPAAATGSPGPSIPVIAPPATPWPPCSAGPRIIW